MVLTKRYYGFGIYSHKARGGMEDIIFKSDSLKEAEELLEKSMNNEKYITVSWVYDMKTETIIRYRIKS